MNNFFISVKQINEQYRAASFIILYFSLGSESARFRKIKKVFFMTENKYFDNLTFLAECSHLFHGSSPYECGCVALSFLNKLKPVSFFVRLIYACMKVGCAFFSFVLRVSYIYSFGYRFNKCMICEGSL